MKASVRITEAYTMQVRAYEKGDEPADAIDLTPELINRWQRARLELDLAEVEIARVAKKAGLDMVRPW